MRVDPHDIAARLGVPVHDVERLAGDRPSAPLPAKADAPAILDRLAVRPDDAAEIMAGWPDPDSPLWTPELRWLLDRSIALVRMSYSSPSWRTTVNRSPIFARPLTRPDRSTSVTYPTTCVPAGRIVRPSTLTGRRSRARTVSST